MTSNYSKLLNRLLSVNVREGVKLGLKNCEDLDKLLGYPSQSFPAIHVAGTNGKGSVSTKIGSAHQSLGLKTGLYTSPHISCFRERIQINEQMITEAQVEEHLANLFTICKQHHIKATFFELTTLIAFLHFSKEKVDIAVFETGLGGRLDATNILKPVLSIITSISLEHTEILGGTIEAIAKEKAGIIKPSIPVIIGPSVPKQLIEKIASESNSPCIQVEGPFEDYHEENCAIAKEALEYLKILPEAIKKGIKALPPCRLETFTQEDLLALSHHAPLPEAIILDVAHNPDGLKHLIKAVRKRYPKSNFRFVVGLSSNKDILGCLQIIKKEGTAFHLIEGDNERAASKKLLADKLANMGVSSVNIFCESSIRSAIYHAIELASQKNEIVIACGTFFIMREIRQALGLNEPQDPIDMNERIGCKSPSSIQQN